jgi:hypothetical protein
VTKAGGVLSTGSGVGGMGGGKVAQPARSKTIPHRGATSRNRPAA